MRRQRLQSFEAALQVEGHPGAPQLTGAENVQVAAGLLDRSSDAIAGAASQ